MKPKLVMLTSRFPYPLEKGDKLRAFHQIRTLGQKFDITLISIADYTVGKKELEKLMPMVTELHVIKLSPLQRLLNLFKALFSGKALQVAFFEDKHAHKYIENIVNELSPHHIYCQLARIAPYVSKLHYPKTLDYMDAFGVGMLRRSSVSSWFMKKLYTIEAKRMIQFEKSMYPYFDYHIVISAQDGMLMNSDNTYQFTVIPNGIDERFFVEKESNKIFDLVFVGNMGYLPNIEAAEYIVKRILPLCPVSTRILIAGARPHRRVKKLISDRIEVTGWVDDITNSYASGKIFVAPLWSGTGQQNKILEAMALGLPCITTDVVNNAIQAVPGKDIFIANDAQDFAKIITILLENNELRNQVGSNAREFVKQNYSWEHYSDVLSNIFTGKSN